MCDHILKVLTWGVDTSKPTAPLIPSLWGCTNCDEQFTELPVVEEVEHERVEHDFMCECFACRVKSIKVAYCGIGGGDGSACIKLNALFVIIYSTRYILQNYIDQIKG